MCSEKPRARAEAAFVAAMRLIIEGSLRRVRLRGRSGSRVYLSGRFVMFRCSDASAGSSYTAAVFSFEAADSCFLTTLMTWTVDGVAVGVGAVGGAAGGSSGSALCKRSPQDTTREIESWVRKLLLFRC